MPRNRVRSTVSVARLALLFVSLSCCFGFALLGSTWLLGGANAASQAPIAAYSLDAGEGAGTVAEDVTGAEHDGTIEGATWTDRGKYGSALQFDGENDCVKVANTEDLQLDEEFTLEAWVRPENLNAFTPIFFKESGTFYSYSLFLGAFNAGHLEGFVADESEEYSEVKSGKALPAKAWSHVAFTSDGAHLRLYVDGQLVDTENASEIAPSEGPLYLGCWPSEGEHFEGRIDEVQIYDRALDGGEIGADLAAGLQSRPSPVIAAYGFDENTGTVAHDYAGGHDGTIEGATWTKGKFGSALDFDASEEDVVTIPTSSDLNVEDFTLEAWVKLSEVNELLPVIAKGSGEGFGYALYGAGAEEPLVPTGYIFEGESVNAFATGEEELSTKAWTHIAVTSDGSKMRFYVNGTLVDTRSGYNEVAGGSTDLQIGGDTSIFNPTYFDGKIDEVRIYGRALSEAEITTDLHSGIDTPQAGPIAAYSLDAGESAGTLAEDVTLNEHIGTIEGATWDDRGKFGKALRFDGVNDCVQIANTEDLQLSEEFTLEAWVRPDSLQEFAPLFFKEHEGFYSYSLFLGAFNSGHLEGFVANEGPGWSEVESKEALPAKAWSHVAFTSDGAYLRLYVDGALVGTGSASEIGESEGPLYLGCWPEEGEHFEGRIDEVRIYDRALDGGEVAGDMIAELQTPRSGPVAAYAFDENTGTVAGDHAGAHDGTIEGAEWTRGKFGSALEFKASQEDVVTIPTSSDLNLEDFTLEAWVKSSDTHPFAPVIAKADPEDFGYELLAGGNNESALPEGWITEGKSVHRYAYSEDRLDEKAWTHIAVTSDGSKLRFYVNGDLVDTRSGANVIAGGGGTLQIGGAASYVPAQWFDGKIDEVRIYGRALSGAEITTDLHSGIQTQQAGPIAAYSLDAGESAGTVAEDVTGEGHEGTIEGATWTDRGKYGSALQFDGENDCVKIANTEDLQLDEEFTLEAWVRPENLNKFTPVFFKESGTFYSYSLFLGAFNSGHLEGFVADESEEWSEVKSGEALPAKTWSHVAFTSDGAYLRLYVDGQLVDTENASEIASSEGPLYLGCWPSEGEHFEGRIDEVRIYDRALDAGEIDLQRVLDTSPPDLELSGALTEGLKEGTTEYPLQVTARDNDPALPRSGLKRATILIDGETVDTVEQECHQGNCSLNREWVYKTGTFGLEAHRLTVETEDQAGNQLNRSAVIPLQSEMKSDSVWITDELFARVEGPAPSESEPAELGPSAVSVQGGTPKRYVKVMCGHTSFYPRAYTQACGNPFKNKWGPGVPYHVAIRGIFYFKPFFWARQRGSIGCDQAAHIVNFIQVDKYFVRPAYQCIYGPRTEDENGGVSVKPGHYLRAQAHWKVLSRANCAEPCGENPPSVQDAAMELHLYPSGKITETVHSVGLPEEL